MVPPPDETPNSLGDGVTGSDVEPSGPEDAQSLGDQHTFDGVAKDTSPQSLGDAQTVGGTDPDGETPFDDGMEVVDLADRYTIEGVLGKGGMGEVLLATDTRLERKVAIKRILGDGARSRTAISRFLTEAKSIAALNHPNIVQIYDYGRAADGPFLIMEFVEGNSLLDRLRDEAMPLEEAIELTCQLCDGLGMAHEANIIHRDIKPANVLLTKTGIPKLTDFGLAKDEAADTGLSVAGAVLGTLDFMPPEQRKDSALTDNRSDLWSLAATLYQMVTGESPRVIDLDGVPQQLRQTFAKALKTKKDDRYQTVREFREALQGCLAAAEPAPEVAVDLGAGECPQCHTKNEATRKFCRECAASLRVECLKCAEEIPVWDKVCAECGGKQIELADARRAELDTQREKAESLRSEYAFDESLRVAQEIGSINDSRLQHLKEWSETFIAEAETEKERQEQNAANHYAEAKTHREAFDYTSAIHAMDAIPEAMRTDDMRRYLRQLRSDHDESTELIQTISDRVKRRDLDGLLEQVNRATELRGDRNDLQKLHIQLIERREKLKRQRDEAFAAAESLLSQGQAKEALAYTKNVSTSELRASDNDLITRLQTIVKAENELTAQVTDSIAGGLDPEKVVMLLRATVAYLQMNPRHKKITGMQAQLIERIQKSPDRYVAELAELAVVQRATAGAGPPRGEHVLCHSRVGSRLRHKSGAPRI